MRVFTSFPFADYFNTVIPNQESTDHSDRIDSDTPNPYKLSHISILNGGCDELTACQHLFQSIYGYQYRIDSRHLICDDMSSRLASGVAVLFLKGADSIASGILEEFTAYNRYPYVMIEPSMLDVLHFADSVTLDFGLESTAIADAKVLFTTNGSTYVGLEFGNIGD
ncbi:hypothetical protein [uncultured Pseudoteredinibacter sp.]|uniref:hypothetical protein n=1 Tax=uncultured Pseudoteredinibacter sp. TaxID=1641701 RepID=UPI002629E857|nr:hypothetical protein [uncultured Pseudoteredinibacter sp.]